MDQKDGNFKILAARRFGNDGGVYLMGFVLLLIGFFQSFFGCFPITFFGILAGFFGETAGTASVENLLE